MPAGSGDTTYLCVVDGDRLAVSLIQSNAAGFGSWLVEPATGINLHNRGLGFSAGARPPGRVRAGPPAAPHAEPASDHRIPTAGSPPPLGTMGGDAQPQILLQLLARLLLHGQHPAEAIASGRVGAPRGRHRLRHLDLARRSRRARRRPRPTGWDAGLRDRGHRVTRGAAFDSAFGHAHTILVEDEGTLAAAADPRALIGSAAGV